MYASETKPFSMISMITDSREKVFLDDSLTTRCPGLWLVGSLDATLEI